MAAAYTNLEVDVARLRSASYADHLELIRLTALVDGLLGQVHPADHRAGRDAP